MKTNPIAQSFRPVDMTTWKRARHYELFAGSSYPYVSFATRLRIHDLLLACRAGGLRFFPAFLFAVMKALNSVENFRYRIVEGKVVLFDRIDPNFVVFDHEDELFYFAQAEYCPDPAVFFASVEAAQRKALADKCLSGDRQDVVHVSCTPWFDFSDVVQPLPIGPGFGIPKAMWGKFNEVNGGADIPFSITAHHGLVDGVHIARLFSAIEDGRLQRKFAP